MRMNFEDATFGRYGCFLGGIPRGGIQICCRGLLEAVQNILEAISKTVNGRFSQLSRIISRGGRPPANRRPAPLYSNRLKSQIEILSHHLVQPILPFLRWVLDIFRCTLHGGHHSLYILQFCIGRNIAAGLQNETSWPDLPDQFSAIGPDRVGVFQVHH